MRTPSTTIWKQKENFYTKNFNNDACGKRFRPARVYTIASGIRFDIMFGELIRPGRVWPGRPDNPKYFAMPLSRSVFAQHYYARLGQITIIEVDTETVNEKKIPLK